MKTKFTIKDLYKIGNGNSSLCKFDFSLLDSELYHSFFEVLPTFLYKKIENVIFTCELFFQEEKAIHKNNRKQEIIKSSIYSKNPNFIPFLIKILKNVLPKTKILQEISFSMMKIPESQYIDLFMALSGPSPTLESVHFSDISFTPILFKNCISLLNPYQYKDISFIKCGLTSDSLPEIYNFFKQKPLSSNINKKIKTFKVEGNILKESDQNSINQILENIELEKNMGSEYIFSDNLPNNDNKIEDSILKENNDVKIISRSLINEEFSPNIEYQKNFNVPLKNKHLIRKMKVPDFNSNDELDQENLNNNEINISKSNKSKSRKSSKKTSRLFLTEFEKETMKEKKIIETKLLDVENKNEKLENELEKEKNRIEDEIKKQKIEIENERKKIEYEKELEKKKMEEEKEKQRIELEKEKSRIEAEKEKNRIELEREKQKIEEEKLKQLLELEKEKNRIEEEK